MKLHLFGIGIRLLIWFLLTADLSLANIVIGLCIALLLPKTKKLAVPPKVWLKTGFQILLMVPQAYGEAIAMMLSPHRQESIEYVPPEPRSIKLTFLDIFRITFTPKTIVLKDDPVRGYKVHRIDRRKTP